MARDLLQTQTMATPKITDRRRLRAVYTYSACLGVEERPLIRATRDAVTVVVSGISGEVVRRRDLDAPGARYFTTPRAAVEAFVAKAEATLADASRTEHHAGWREVLAEARARLEVLS